jgi:hypothetical protein
MGNSDQLETGTVRRIREKPPSPAQLTPDGWECARLTHNWWSVLHLQDVNKKPYTFRLTFPHDLAFIKYRLAKLGRTNHKVCLRSENILYKNGLMQ